jgi:hypothetical protein
MDIVIFYSWQSDRPNSVNRNLIQDALQQAIDRIRGDDHIQVDPVLDRDTQGVPGLPEIAQTILAKIEKSSLFLADVSFINNHVEQDRLTPNPNVLIELGYAAAKLGWERIICVMNETYGTAEQLPFDIRHRRWPIRYRLNENDNSKDETRQKLSEDIEYAIRNTVQSGILVTAVNPKDRRVARKFEGSINLFSSTLLVFLHENGMQDGLHVFLEDHSDVPGSNYPDPECVNDIVDVFSKNNLKGPSNTRIGDNRLNWAEAFISGLKRLNQECVQILDRYADRDDALISSLEEVQERAHTLAFLISSPFTAPSLENLYDNGVPDIHIDFFRYFFLSLVKAHRVIRQFR